VSATLHKKRKHPAVGIVVAATLLVVVGCMVGAVTTTGPGSLFGESGEVLWSGDFSTGDLSQYDVQACAPDRAQVVRDPRGLDRNVVRFSVRNTDVAPCTPTENPRAQALSPEILQPGGDYWVGWSVLVPKDFPTTRARGDNWISLGSIYGPPADGPSGTGIKMDTTPRRDVFYYRRDDRYRFDEPWRMPLVRGRWVDFVVHFKLSRNPKVGYREQWVNDGSGWRQSRLHGKKRLYTATLGPANGAGPNVSKVSLYYRRGLMKAATIYFAEHRIGTSFSAVAPHSYD
jgi:hypothetical protein